MYLQDVDTVYDIDWNGHIKYGDIFKKAEYEHSKYSFEIADIDMLKQLFDMYEKEATRVLDLDLVLPGYDYVLKCSHTFNLLDARGAISVSQRAAYISRVRNMARLTAQKYIEQREAMGYPLIKKGEDDHE